MRFIHCTFFAAAASLAAGASAAFGHIHITVDTLSGQPGDPVIIRAGYLPGERAYAIDRAGRLRFNGEIAEFDLIDTIDQPGDFKGWTAGDEILLTSDFFAGSGRLNGGDFQYEIVSVEPVEGGDGSLLAWGSFSTGQWVVDALSSAATRPERSFDAGLGGHDHAQACAAQSPGVWDITLVGWDSNGIYADSTPVTIRFHAEPGLPCPADIDASGAVDIDDLLGVINSWGPCGGCPADFEPHDGDGVVDIDEILAVINGWGACP